MAENCVHVAADPVTQEIEHHLRHQTGAVHGAGKRQRGFSRGERHGEVLEAYPTTAEGAGSRVRETE